MSVWTSPTVVHSACGYTQNYGTHKFIDGDLGTHWGCSNNELHWIILDLGQSYFVSSVRVYLGWYWGFHKWDSVDIYVSDDPSNFGSAVATGVSFACAPSSSCWSEQAFSEKEGRYVKLDGIDTQDAVNKLEGIEFEAYCASGFIPSPHFSGRSGGINESMQGGIGR